MSVRAFLRSRSGSTLWLSPPSPRGCSTSGAQRLVKLALAVAKESPGAVRSNVRKALEAGDSADEIRHVVLLAITTCGFPTAVACLQWVDDVPAATHRTRRPELLAAGVWPRFEAPDGIEFEFCGRGQSIPELRNMSSRISRITGCFRRL